MKWFVNGILLATLLSIAALPVAAQELPRATPADAGMSAERLTRLTGALEAYVEQERLPGAVAMVLRDGKVVYSQSVGYRDRESRNPLRTDAIFRIASQTKALVSVGIMMLQEEGALLISDPLSKYLPEFQSTAVASPDGNGGYEIVAAQRQITLRDLLTHTSGLGYGGGTRTFSSHPRNAIGLPPCTACAVR